MLSMESSFGEKDIKHFFEKDFHYQKCDLAAYCFCDAPYIFRYTHFSVQKPLKH